MNSYSKNKSQEELNNDMVEDIFDDDQNSSISHYLAEAIFQSNQEDPKGEGNKNNNSELSSKSTDVDDINQKDKERAEVIINESQNILENEKTKNKRKQKFKIVNKFSISFKKHLKKEIKKIISKKKMKLLFSKKDIFHKLFKMLKKYVSKFQTHKFKDILKRIMIKIFKNDINFKKPKKLLEFANINIINNSDPFDNIFYWKKIPCCRDEILNLNIIRNISCNKEIFNQNEGSNISEEMENELNPNLSLFDILPDTSYITKKTMKLL